VESYSDRYGEKILKDHEWLREVLADDRIALSRDWNMFRDPLSRRAVMETRGRLFILRGNLNHPALAQMFVESLDRVERVLASHAEPFVAVVRREPAGSGEFRGVVEVRLTLEQWSAAQSAR
jgi:hypothetical protein